MKRYRFLALYLFSFALVIRLAFLAVTFPGSENVRYWEDVGIAINLVDGKGYVLNFTMVLHPQDVPLRPTAAKPPVYPLLISLVFFIFGMKNFLALFVLHALLAACTCSLIYLAIAKLSQPKAVIAALAFALYPPFVYHSVTTPESTTVLLFLISLFCYAILNLYRAPGQNRWVVVSILGGLLALTEPVTLPFVFLAYLYVAYLTLDSFTAISLQILTALLFLTAIIAPWTLRNYLAFNELVFIKSNFGSTLKDSMYRAGVRLPKETYASLRQQIKGIDEVSEDKAVKAALLNWIRQNPVAYLQLLPTNFMNFWWEVDSYRNDWSPGYLFGRKIPYTLLLVLSIPAMLWTLCRLGTHQLHVNVSFYQGLMLILILTYTAIYTFIGAMNLRYHFPVQLALVIFSAETVLYMLPKLRSTS